MTLSGCGEGVRSVVPRTYSRLRPGLPIPKTLDVAGRLRVSKHGPVSLINPFSVSCWFNTICQLLACLGCPRVKVTQSSSPVHRSMSELLCTMREHVSDEEVDLQPKDHRFLGEITWTPSSLCAVSTPWCSRMLWIFWTSIAMWPRSAGTVWRPLARTVGNGKVEYQERLAPTWNSQNPRLSATD